MGRGKAYGRGPLPVFIRGAVEAGLSGREVSVVVLRTDEKTSKTQVQAASERSVELVDPIGSLVSGTHVVTYSSLAIPWKELVTVFQEAVGVDFLSEGGETNEVRFLVVGCQTEYRVFEIASFLKNILGCSEVAVASHLVGSATQEAHFAALQHNLPGAGIRVFLDLEEAAVYAGLTQSEFSDFGRRPCAIEPSEARDILNPEKKRIIELLCMHWTEALLRPLAGGYSGSTLFLAEGRKGDARTEPIVVKVDRFSQMRQELGGYRRVKDFLGKHVPTFGYPVTQGEFTGVAMELAAMEGKPRTLQDSFEAAEGEESLQLFMLRLNKALDLLSEKLYRNTKQSSWVVPYRVFGLHGEIQVKYLIENAEFVCSYLESEAPDVSRPNFEQLAKVIGIIAANTDGLESEVCLAHGDLNYANVICDEGDNVWFIDWTHCDEHPVELDFAKLENDVKFVISQSFDFDDLPRMRKLEEYLLTHRLPADSNSLPDNLKFAKWDLRFRKALDAVRKIREACFSLKPDEDWLVYRIALLRYALHTLSFDKRRDRGECEPHQLMAAYYSVESLAFDLVADDFHLKIRAERPGSYPARQRISIDESPWLLDCEAYDPPYHVDSLVLASDRLSIVDGWADPEEFDLVRMEQRITSAKHHDDHGRALNPRGRTGIAGRGLLGRWGANDSVAAVVLRKHKNSDELDLLLGSKEKSRDLDLPKGFVLPEEDHQVAMARVLEGEAGWRPEEEGEIVFEGYTYDPRQTDHAWVESHTLLFQTEAEVAPGTFEPGSEFDEIRWWPLNAETVNRIPTGQVRFVREGVTRLMDTGRVDKPTAERLLAAT
jgi:ADP-ribose pyrophosphatase